MRPLLATALIPLTRNLAVLMVLAGCQTTGPSDQVAISEPTPVMATKSVPAKIEVARAIPKPERSYPEPASLQGLSGGGVIKALGEPEFVRRDQPAKIWQYRGTVCTLDIFLYQEAVGAPYAVNYIEARTRQGAALSHKDCIVSILKEREAPAS